MAPQKPQTRNPDFFLISRILYKSSPTRLALEFLQFRIDIGCGLTGTRFSRDLAAVPPVVETGSPLIHNTYNILRATPSAASPHSREEGCVVVAMLC